MFLLLYAGNGAGDQSCRGILGAHLRKLEACATLNDAHSRCTGACFGPSTPASIQLACHGGGPPPKENGAEAHKKGTMAIWDGTIDKLQPPTPPADGVGADLEESDPQKYGSEASAREWGG